jgi:glycerate 2-kinase
MSLLPSPHADPRAFLRALYDAAVARAQPAVVMREFLPTPPKGRTVAIGGGKASGAMAAALDALWPAAAPLSGVVLTRYDHVPASYRARPGRIDLREAAHPVPDEAGRRGALDMLSAVRGLTEDDLVIALISGGGSALLSVPAPGLSFEDKQQINRDLLASGASIDQMNCVRKHLSAIKGGRLAAACAPARVHTLLISDVPGDVPDVIASGPTLPDPTTCAEAPPEISAITRSSSVRPRTAASMSIAPRRPASSGTGCAASRRSMRPGRAR